MSDTFVQALLTLAFAAFAGGVTNAIAVWMLFHPYEPPRLFGLHLRFFQGAIPKNKRRLAVAMGRTVGNKLLTPDDLARTLAEPAFRAAFDERLRTFLAATFDRERGSLEETLPAPLAAELRLLLGDVAARLRARFEAYAATAEFRTQVERAVGSLAAELHDRPIGAVFTAEREAMLASAADHWLHELVEGDAFAAATRDYLDRAKLRLLRPDRTIQELLPTGLVAAVERAIASYLPIALARLGSLLEDPGARARIEEILHELLDRFMRDLRFHQRLVAALVITPETIDKVIRAIEEEGAAKISEVLHDAAVREAMARGVNAAIVDLLARPVVSVLGEPGEETVESAQQTVQAWLLSLARDRQTRAFVVEKLQAVLGGAQRHTWGDLLRHVPPARVADMVADAAASERARELFRELADLAVDWIMHRPIGRVSAHLGTDAVPRIERALAEPLWCWLQEQAPPIVQRLDVAARVEQKIMEYPTEQLEALVRGVTERELRLIVHLGYVLGAVIGAVLLGVNRLL